MVERTNCRRALCEKSLGLCLGKQGALKGLGQRSGHSLTLCVCKICRGRGSRKSRELLVRENHRLGMTDSQKWWSPAIPCLWGTVRAQKVTTLSG